MVDGFAFSRWPMSLTRGCPMRCSCDDLLRTTKRNAVSYLRPFLLILQFHFIPPPSNQFTSACLGLRPPLLMKLLIVVVNYRVAELTIDCLSSIAAEIDSVPDTRVVVCENGSGDRSAELIQKAIIKSGWHSWCALIDGKVNLGFTGGNNLVLRQALASADKPQYVLLLNPDTIVRLNAFRALVDFMDLHPDVGISGSRLEDPDGTPQRSAFRFPSPFSEFEGNLKFGLVSKLLREWVVAPPVPSEACETDWVAGASMMIRREVLEAIGVLDEGYFTYYEDVDFCFNARRAGWLCWYVPTSRVVHLVGQSSGITAEARKRLPAYFFAARRRYFLKNHGAFLAAAADASRIAGLLLWRLRVLLTGKKDSTPPHFLRDSFRHSLFFSGVTLKDVAGPVLRPQDQVSVNTIAPKSNADGVDQGGS
jgi:N-acetylglucosaminyl-diphospho-decaprenol L-rhamnosyltransferase